MGGALPQPCTRPHTHTWFVLGPVPFACPPQPPEDALPSPPPSGAQGLLLLAATLKTGFQRRKFRTPLPMVYPPDRIQWGCPPRGTGILTGIKALSQRNRALQTVEFQAFASGKGVFKLRGNEAFFGAPEITSCRQLLIRWTAAAPVDTSLATPLHSVAHSHFVSPSLAVYDSFVGRRGGEAPGTLIPILPNV